MGEGARIVTFGDSMSSQTYAGELKELVREQGRRVIGYTYPGYTTEGLSKHLDQILGVKPDFIVILAGTCDLDTAMNYLNFREMHEFISGKIPDYEGADSHYDEWLEAQCNRIAVEYMTPRLEKEVNSLFSRLVEFYSRCRQAGVEPVSVTIPSMALSHPKPFDFDYFEIHVPLTPSTRPQINEMIRNHCAEENISCVDLYAATTDPTTGKMLEPLTHDGVHFNNEGSYLFASLVYDKLVPLMERGVLH
ncbi:MAG TPA: SGNH/GDSL hydrolase family protein [Candidatus Nanoarchaeia archaeon]|nr:SGNH/GDSL hydrolase family protein [Candidatus Nanoarchaeia archaeon]